MIVFEHLQVDNGGEFWELGSLPNYDDTSIQLQTASDSSGKFAELPSNAYRLNNVKRILNVSGMYWHLYHVAWQQPGLSASNLRKVFIDIPEAGIVGTVGLAAGHLLHVKVDLSYLIEAVTELAIPLIYTEADVKQGGDQDENQLISDNDYMHGRVAHLKEIRQLKLNELHYFDHPLFGVLIQVSRRLKK